MMGSAILLGGCLTCVLDIIKPGTLLINVWDINSWRPFLMEEFGIPASGIVASTTDDVTGGSEVGGTRSGETGGEGDGAGGVAHGGVGNSAGGPGRSESHAVLEKLIKDGLVKRADVERVTREIENAGEGSAVKSTAHDLESAAGEARSSQGTNQTSGASPKRWKSPWTRSRSRSKSRARERQRREGAYEVVPGDSEEVRTEASGPSEV